MQAYKAIWRSAGWLADVLGRLKVIAWGALLLSGLVFVLWAVVLRTFGVIGTAVLVLGVVLLAAAVSGLISSRRKPARSLEGPAIALHLPDRPCERYPHTGGGQCVYCHLAVKALSDLRRCHARLIHLERAIDRQWVPDLRFAAPTRLKWANVGPEHPGAEYRDLAAGETALLDVVYTLERSPGHAFVETLDPSPIEPSRDLLPGQYLLTVRVAADGRAPVDYTVSVGVPEAAWWSSVSMGQHVGPPVAAGFGPE